MPARWTASEAIPALAGLARGLSRRGEVPFRQTGRVERRRRQARGHRFPHGPFRPASAARPTHPGRAAFAPAYSKGRPKQATAHRARR